MRYLEHVHHAPEVLGLDGRGGGSEDAHASPDDALLSALIGKQTRKILSLFSSAMNHSPIFEAHALPPSHRC